MRTFPFLLILIVLVTLSSRIVIDFAAFPYPVRDLKERNDREIAKAIQDDKLNAWKNKAVKVGPTISLRQICTLTYRVLNGVECRQGQLVLFFGRPTLQFQLMKKKVNLAHL